MHLLDIVARLQLPDCWIAAGFVRNLVWDYLHDYPATPFNDVDVIYFDPAQAYEESSVLETLRHFAPSVNWEVKNQAKMHLKHHDKPYENTTEAMMHWPEKETAVGVRLDNNGQIEINAPFGLASLFKGHLTFNPVRSKEVFEHRVNSKHWLKTWPKLKLDLGQN